MNFLHLSIESHHKGLA